MRHPAALPAALALWLLALSWSVAAGAPQVVSSSRALAGAQAELALAGPATLLASARTPQRHEGPNLLQSLTPGHRPTVLARIDFPANRFEGSRHSLGFAASSSRVAMLDLGRGCAYKGTDCISIERMLTGPLAGPFAEPPPGCAEPPSVLAQFGPEHQPLEHTAVAVDGEVLAYGSFQCIVAEDAATGLRRVIALQALFDPEFDETRSELRVAGRLLAYRVPPTSSRLAGAVVVYDIDRAGQLYSVPLPKDSASGPTFDLQADGTLVIADARSCRATISTPAHPAPRSLGIRACAVRRVRDGRALLVIPAPDGRRALAWSSLSSVGAHHIADLGIGGYYESALADMDGTATVYALAGCEAPTVYRTQLGNPGSPPPPPATCPILVRSRHATLTPRRLSVEVSCARGCRGWFDVLAGTPRQLRDGHGVLWRSEHVEFALAAHRRRRISLLHPQDAAEHLTPKILLRRSAHRPNERVELIWHVQTPYAERARPGANRSIVLQSRYRANLPIVRGH